ncbi:methyltransferase-like protein 7A [Fopius arisanus]|uniref:Methyltransferase-like protein 7A n=1 Tax=Fopius arisanus TaxID=64838 RepID=A0A9R1U130_9HYME|nr:PREDICTED: methyltransferase-like protein 7A [Fopius arisanus]
MGTSDLWIKDILTVYGSTLLTILIIVYIINWRWTKFVKNIYRLHLMGFETECAELAVNYKERLFAPLNEAFSNDEILKVEGAIRLLEIGVKTGENFHFYPDKTHLICVDWNYKLEDYLTKSDRAWQFSHIKFEKLIIGDGTSLKEIPSNYVDAVVTVRSLCSCSSVRETLGEIRRVLAPGGKYFFLEHIPEQEETFTHWFQWFLTKSKIYPSLFGDCRLDSSPLNDINTAGFSKISCESIILKGYVTHPYHLYLTRNHIMGIASK